MEHLCPIFLFSFMTYYRILTRVAWQVPVEEQELFTIPDDLSCSIFRFLCFIDQYLSSYLFFWPLYCLSFFDYTRLPVWYLLAIVLSVLLWLHQITHLVSFGHCIVCPSLITPDYPFGIFWPLYCLSFFDYTRLPLWYL